MNTDVLESPSTVAGSVESRGVPVSTLRDRLRFELIVIGVCAVPSLFTAGIALNTFPDLVRPLTESLCGSGMTLNTGLKAIPYSRGGAEGFARCVDQLGMEHADVFAQSFFIYWAALTLALYLTVVVSGVLRSPRA
jgi:hypothetical protein